MGFSDAPAPTVLRPTFDDVAMVIDAFIAQRAPGPLTLYMHESTIGYASVVDPESLRFSHQLVPDEVLEIALRGD